MTANEVYNSALALIDAYEKNGTISPTKTADYAGRAPALLALLQRELAFHEDFELTTDITSLDDELEISDDTAKRIMPYGLAAAFALADFEADKYADYTAKYQRLIRTIRHDEEDITDEYYFLTGLQ